MKRSRRNYFIRIVVILAFTAAIIFCAMLIRPTSTEKIDSEDDIAESHDLILWYYDPVFENYTQELKEDYFRTTGLKIECKLVSAVEFFENINKLNVEKDENAPDLYIVESTKLEQAYLGSVAKENTDTSTYNLAHFAKTSLNASTCNEKLVAYPFAFDVGLLVYNTDFQIDPPNSFDEILTSSASFIKDDRSSIDMVALFDPNSLISNFEFIGAYLNIGGEYGDNSKEINTNSEELQQALSYYKQFASKVKIDKDTVTYDLVENSFVFSRCTTAIINCSTLAALNRQKTNYKIAQMPPLNDTLESKALSTTWCVCVNPISKNTQTAESLAKYMTYENINYIYDLTGLISCKRVYQEENGFQDAYTQYENSYSLPKMIETQEIWKDLKLMLNSVWGDTSSESALEKFNDSLNKALSTRTSNSVNSESK